MEIAEEILNLKVDDVSLFSEKVTAKFYSNGEEGLSVDFYVKTNLKRVIGPLIFLTKYKKLRKEIRDLVEKYFSVHDRTITKSAIGSSLVRIIFIDLKPKPGNDDKIDENGLKTLVVDLKSEGFTIEEDGKVLSERGISLK